MKLSQHLKFSKFLIESKSPGSIYRVMDIEELVHLLRDKEWELTNNKFENIDIDDNVMDDSQENIKKLQSSLVYKKNKEYPYSRSFARSLLPGLIQNHFDPDTSVIVEFDKEALSNLRNTRITAIDTSLMVVLIKVMKWKTGFILKLDLLNFLQSIIFLILLRQFTLAKIWLMNYLEILK